MNRRAFIGASIATLAHLATPAIAKKAIMTTRTSLEGPTTFILSPNGQDVGDGQDSPWRSLGYAMDRIWFDFDARGNFVNVQLWPGQSATDVYDQAADYDAFQVHGPMLGGVSRYPILIEGMNATVNPMRGPHLVTIKGMNIMTGGAQAHVARCSADSLSHASPDVGGFATDDGGSHCYLEGMRFVKFRDFYAQAGTGSRMKLAPGVHYFTAHGTEKNAFSFVGPGAQLQVYGGGGMMFFHEDVNGNVPASPPLATGNPNYPIGFFYGTERSWANIGAFGWNGLPRGPRVSLNYSCYAVSALPAASCPGDGSPAISPDCRWAG